MSRFLEYGVFVPDKAKGQSSSSSSTSQTTGPAAAAAAAAAAASFQWAQVGAKWIKIGPDGRPLAPDPPPPSAGGGGGPAAGGSSDPFGHTTGSSTSSF
ncbi:unnamed protein product, partial [Laminaria digitata]